jgi:C4-dicarboxylate-specific signal transduction histidine kinase
VATAFGVALLAQSVFAAGFWFIFLVGVIVSARLGKGPGWLAIFLSTAAVKYLFTSSSYILPRTADDILFVSNFLASAVAVSWAVFQVSGPEAPGRVPSDVDRQIRNRTAALEKANVALLLEVDTYKHIQAELAERTRAELETQMAEMTRTQAHVTHVSRIMSMDELNAAIAHEVNQPLTAVITSARACERWLGGEPPNVATARASLERIIRDGNRASQIISRIRSLFKKNPPQKEPLDVNELILEMIALQHSEGTVDGVAIQTALAADLPILYADRVQLQQVVLNLMRNAIDAMAEIADRPKQLYINSCKERAGRVSVSFTDSGVGLSPDHAHKIFNAFFTTKANGLGMGLAISRSIIESHGGRIRAKPRPQGTTFEFTLPIEGQGQR